MSNLSTKLLVISNHQNHLDEIQGLDLIFHQNSFFQLPESRLVENFHIFLDFLVQIYLQGSYKLTQKLLDRFFIITIEGCSLSNPFMKKWEADRIIVYNPICLLGFRCSLLITIETTGI